MYTFSNFDRALYALHICRKIVGSGCYITNEHGDWSVIISNMEAA